ncbi:MAG TPA: O-acetyl-ADP-ribose deacetylase [Candidatus Hydrogenedentes bacterium]|nr:O-acetyl-ADP-ribose deacetylase [Candidatus Hydrogenedentota bacterium]HRK35387.1 O-acetyl-ADP-ribose deacetylase [Candidatus Hydrogenedentota bacterium]
MWRIADTTIEIVQGDITLEVVDAIVNAANAQLAGGGGVDGAIHRAGGPAIMEQCRLLGGCPTGEARITTGGNLRARFVIHAVGPIYRDGMQGEPELLASCYRRSLELAAEHALESVAFPAISCGVYAYPVPAASRIALAEVGQFAMRADSPHRVRFVLFCDSIRVAFETAAAELWGASE